MYKAEMCRGIERALHLVLSYTGALPGFSEPDPEQMAQNIRLLAEMVAEQLWTEGYQLELRDSSAPPPM
jgi:hypothetical protein